MLDPCEERQERNQILTLFFSEFKQAFCGTCYHNSWELSPARINADASSLDLG